MRDRGRATEREFVHVELAEKYGACFAELTHDNGIFRRHALCEQCARGRRANARRIDVVLEQCDNPCSA